jgi:hypothetical protein
MSAALAGKKARTSRIHPGVMRLEIQMMSGVAIHTEIAHFDHSINYQFFVEQNVRVQNLITYGSQKPS